MSQQEERPRPKRSRTFAPGDKWMPYNKSKGDLTRESVEQIFMMAFELDKFPGWDEPVKGHLMVSGKMSGSQDVVFFSFWPTKGAILFQGKEEERIINTLKWEKAFALYLSLTPQDFGRFPNHLI